MKKNTKVSWTLKDGMCGGSGTTITDEVDGTIQVKVEETWASKSYKGVRTEVTQYETHYVIHCTVTWLSVLPVAEAA